MSAPFVEAVTEFVSGRPFAQFYPDERDRAVIEARIAADEARWAAEDGEGESDVEQV